MRSLELEQDQEHKLRDAAEKAEKEYEAILEKLVEMRKLADAKFAVYDGARTELANFLVHKVEGDD